MDHHCEVCNIVFKSNINFERHKNTKRHKKQSTGDRVIYDCGCGKFYSHRASFYRHKKQCSYADTNHKEPENIIQSLQERLDKQDKEIERKNQEMDELRKKIEMLIENTNGSNTNNTHIQNQTIKNQNNIDTQNIFIVNNFGSENMDYLTDKEITNLIKNNGPVICIPKLIESIHFDPRHPENHNIKVTNMKNNHAKIFNDNKWITTNKKRAIDSMIENSCVLLEEKYQDNKNSISEFRQERFQQFQNKYVEQDKDMMKIIKDEVDITLINGTNEIYTQKNGEFNG